MRVKSTAPSNIVWKSGYILVSGSRTWDNITTIRLALESYKAAFDNYEAPDKPSELVVLTGHAQGADTLAELVADALGLAVEIEPAVWTEHTPERCEKVCSKHPERSYCSLAGIVRNEKMVDEYHPDVTLAFVRGEDSRGTSHTIEYARKNNVPVRTYFADEPVTQAAENKPAVAASVPDVLK